MTTFTHQRRSAFTLLDLIVLLVLMPILLCGLTCGGLCRNRETANRVKCASQLRSIGQAILLYSNENKGAYPRTIATTGPSVTPTWGTGVTSPNPFEQHGPRPNDVSAALFLLLRTQDPTSGVFNCPSSNTEKDTYGGKTAIDRSNFSDVKKHLSYSYQNPYPDDTAVERGFRLKVWDKDSADIGLDADFAIMSDINPGTTGTNDNVLAVTTSSSAQQMKRANSNNHNEDGQNVLYADGHVEFQQNPFVGVDRDNIFTARTSENPDPKTELIVASPYDAKDSILLPTDD